MIIGVPRERKTLEKRVALTPDGAAALKAHGHSVLIEKEAGAGSFFTDSEYEKAGATMILELSGIWNKADLVLKVKEPHELEYQFFRSGLAVFDYLHLAGLPQLTRALLKGEMTGIAYELVQTADRRLPLLEPMSEVAGKLAAQNGAYFLQSQHGGRGLLLGGAGAVPPGKVVVVGAGVSGCAACEVALGMGAQVTVMDINSEKLKKLDQLFNSRITTIISTPASLEDEIETADLLIGAVLVPGAAAPHVITRKMVCSMKPGAVFVDLSVDQGGCSETTHTTSLADPIYQECGVIHYCVPNVPAQTPRTSTLALTAATLPYVLELADKGIEKALRENKALKNALNTYRGKLTNKLVSEAVAEPFMNIDEALGALL